MMHAPASLLLAAAGLAAVSAQSTTTIQALLPMADQQTLVGSVVSAGPTAATYLVRCPPGTDSNDCGFPKPFSLVSGPSTLSMIASNGPQASVLLAPTLLGTPRRSRARVLTTRCGLCVPRDSAALTTLPASLGLPRSPIAPRRSPPTGKPRRELSPSPATARMSCP